MSIEAFIKRNASRTETWLDGRVTWHVGSIEDRLSQLRPGTFDAVLTDPPYHLTAANESRGLMGQRWDGGAVAFNPETWRAVIRTVKPGAIMAAFGGPRTFHRLAVGAEDGGFELLETCMWIFSQGMPKGQDAAKAIDKKLGVKIKTRGHISMAHGEVETATRSNLERQFPGIEAHQPVTEQAKRWDGYNNSLKPAYEPILIMRRPGGDTFADQLLLYDTGGLNIRPCRIGQDEHTIKGGGANYYAGFKTKYPSAAVNQKRIGRFPANVLLSHHPLCTKDKCVSVCPVRMLDKQSGVLNTGPSHMIVRRNGKHVYGKHTHTPFQTYGDSGGASRFFYIAKVCRAEREAGLDGLPERDCDNYGDDEWGKENRNVQKARNHHPCLKPIDLCRYFATLILPPPRKTPRRILVPFSGVGSEVIGALLAGWDEVVAIEKDPTYAAIAKPRIEHWCKQAESATKPSRNGNGTHRAKSVK